MMEAEAIMHNMVVEARRDGYESQIFNIAKESMLPGNFIDVNGNESVFEWKTKNVVADDTERGEYAWAVTVERSNEKVTDEVAHYALKTDLVDHIWNINGSV